MSDDGATQPIIHQRFDTKREAISAAKNMIGWGDADQLYVLRMFRATPEYFLVVNEPGIAHYRGQHAAKIVMTLSY